MLTLEAADHLGRSAEDVSTCRRSKIQPQLTLSRNSSTDEASSTGISRAFLTPERKPRRFVSRALPNATHTHTDGFARACATAGCSRPQTHTDGRAHKIFTRNRNAGRWSAQEHARFVDGLEKYGRRKWIRIAEHVGTRTVIQVRSHAQKYLRN